MKILSFCRISQIKRPVDGVYQIDKAFFRLTDHHNYAINMVAQFTQCLVLVSSGIIHSFHVRQLHRNSTKMVSFNDFSCFFQLFYITGHAMYLPNLHTARKNQIKFLTFLPFIVQVTIAIVGLVLFFYRVHQSSMESVQFFSSICKCVNFIPNFIVIFEIFIESCGVIVINQKLLFICNILNSQLKTPFQLRNFKSEYNWDLLLYLIMFLVHVLVLIFAPYFAKNLEIVLLFGHIFKQTAIVHALFYIIIFKYILISLNDQLKAESVAFSLVILNEIPNQQTNDYSIAHLKRIRYLYINLCEVMWLFRKQFGWRLLAIFADSAISLTYIVNITITHFFRANLSISWKFIRKYFLDSFWFRVINS